MNKIGYMSEFVIATVKVLMINNVELCQSNDVLNISKYQTLMDKCIKGICAIHISDYLFLILGQE